MAPIRVSNMDVIKAHKIAVKVATAFIESQSDTEQDRYFFAYTVTIQNKGEVPAKLLSRHWIITDSNGKVQEVRGAGVVGEQPYLRPGEGFQYTSGTMLETPVGTMRGSYQMIADDGTEFNAEIKPFTLAVPRVLH
jgi:ApaG protein